MATFSTLPTNLSAAAYVRMSTDQQELSVATQRKRPVTAP